APERVISAAASAIEVSFKHPDGESLSPEVARLLRQNEFDELGIVPKSALAPAPEPAPDLPPRCSSGTESEGGRTAMCWAWRVRPSNQREIGHVPDLYSRGRTG